MRVAATSAISIGIHAALCAAVLLGSAKPGKSDAPLFLHHLQIAFPAPQSDNRITMHVALQFRGL